MGQEKKPILRFFVDDGRVERQVYPTGTFIFKYEPLDDFEYIYELQLDGDLVFSDTQDKNKNWIMDYTRLYNYVETEQLAFILFYAEKLNSSGVYETYWSGQLDLRGKYDNSARKCRLNAVTESNYKTLSEEIDTEFNMFDLGLERVNVNYSTTDYDNSIVFFDMIDKVVNNILGTNFVSDLLEDTTNPLTNENPNPLNYLILAQKSDVVNPDASDPATVGLFTLQDAMKWMNTLFNGGWTVDSNGDLRFENWLYFYYNKSYSSARAVDLDLTTFNNGDNIREIESYEYIEENIYRKERFETMESQVPLFLNLDINYDAKKTKNNTMVRAIDNMTLDIGYIRALPDRISKEGFVLMATTYNSTDYDLNEQDYDGEFTGTQNIGVAEGSNPSLPIPAQMTTNGIDQFTCNDQGTGGFAFVKIQSSVMNSTVKIGDKFVLTFICTSFSSTRPNEFEIRNSSNVAISNKVTMTGITDNEHTFIISADADSCYLAFTSYPFSMRISLNTILVTRFGYQDLPNGYLAWPNLIDLYYQNGRPFTTGTIDGVEKSFNITNFQKKGIIIKGVPLGKDYVFDPEKLIRTDIGDGRLMSAKVNKNTFEYDLELMY